MILFFSNNDNGSHAVRTAIYPLLVNMSGTLALMSEHPLQSALDRVSEALYTSIDLFDIADGRKPVSKDGRKRTRTDARQSSLYRAIITSSIGTLEEAFESLSVQFVLAQGAPPSMTGSLTSFAAAKMQSTAPKNVKTLFESFGGPDPLATWTANLRYARPAKNLKIAERKNSSQKKQEIYQTYGPVRTFTPSETSQILAFFTNIRHSFAHQDSSKSVFIKPQIEKLYALSQSKYWATPHTPEQISFIESASTACGLFLRLDGTDKSSPVLKWMVHETHALNSIFLAIEITTSIAFHLAERLEVEHGIPTSDHDVLHLKVQEGAWQKFGWWHGDEGDKKSPIQLVPYRPGARD